MISVEYFMDEMTMYEARDISKNVLYVDRNARELDRYKLYVAIQSNSKKKYKPQEILELPWDNRWLDKTEFEYSEEDDKRTQEQADSIADLLNNGMIDFDSTNLMKETQSKPKIDDNKLDA